MNKLIHVDKNGKPTGKEIYWNEDCNDIEKLKCQVMMFAMNGLGYSEPCRKIQEKIKRLKKKKMN